MQPNTIQKQIDIKKLINRFLQFKFHFFVLSIIFLGAAFFKNKMSLPIYKNSTTFTIEKETGSKQFLSSREFFGGLDVLSAQKNVENELAIISSYNLAFETIKKLDLKVSYFEEKQVFSFLNETVSRDIYKQNPFSVIINSVYPQTINTPFYVKILNEDEFELSVDSYGQYAPLYNFIEDEVETYKPPFTMKNKFKFGQEIKTEYFNFKLILNEGVNVTNSSDTKYYFKLNNIKALAIAYQYSIAVDANLAVNTIIAVSMEGNNYFLIHDYLNELTNSYINENLGKKNDVALKTINFIESQISSISDSLSMVERKLQSFRATNSVTDLTFQGEQLLQRISNLETERAQLQMKIKYFDYIRNYFNRNTELSNLNAPSIMGVNDPVLNKLIQELLGLSAQRIQLMADNNTKNLFLKNLDLQIENQKKTILEYTNNNLQTSRIGLDDLNKRIDNYSDQIRQLPGTERQLFGIQRQFKINDAIYTYLLQKRAEAKIAQASNLPDVKVIEEARIIYPNQIGPNTMLNYIIAVFLSLMIVVGFVLIKDFLNTKVVEKSDVKFQDKIPEVGELQVEKLKNKNSLMTDMSKTLIAESFRAFKTNLIFFEYERPIQTILITSSVSGEGKSFIARNLAAFLTENGKKAVLLDFDLRKPDLHHHLENNSNLGLTSFLINSATIDDIISETSTPNLHFIAGGPLAPNPYELVASQNTDTLFELLREMYDYIIVDTSPVGLISETLLLMKRVDFNIFTVRLNYSITDVTNTTLAQIDNKKIENMGLLFNGMERKSSKYRYKYGSKYYDQGRPGKKRRFRIFKRK